ncbi:MAG: hypothetical protein IBV52_01480 [Candidatus Bathyarchaeota archaeon]
MKRSGEKMKSLSDYQIKQAITLSQRLVKKDSEYREYAGADLMTALKIAKIDSLKESGLIPEKMMPLVDFYRMYLVKKRKAFFASMSTELTKLGFLLGMDTKSLIGTTENESVS